MRVDAHHHFWDPTRRAYPWMGDDLAPLRRPFGPDDLAPLLAQNGIEATVIVQTVSTTEETAEFLGIAAATDFVRGVVGWVDLRGDVASQLHALRSEPGGDRLRGIRHQVHDESDPRWVVRRDVERGIAAVGEAGLAYDLLVRTRELPASLELVRRNRDMQFVIDHAAKPRIALGNWDGDWERALAPFSDLPHVACKLSGLVTEAQWSSWSTEQLEPYVTRAISWFGRERCLFGSDWPVCLVAAGYDRIVSTMRELTGDDDAIFGETAMRVYRLG